MMKHENSHFNWQRLSQIDDNINKNDVQKSEIPIFSIELLNILPYSQHKFVGKPSLSLSFSIYVSCALELGNDNSFCVMGCVR